MIPAAIRRPLIIILFFSTLFYSAYSASLTITTNPAAAGESTVTSPASAAVRFRSTTSSPLTASQAIVSLTWHVSSGTYVVRLEVVHATGTTVAETSVSPPTSSVTLSLSPAPPVRQISEVRVVVVKIA